MKVGNAILLNGASSAGKSTLAKELQGILDEVYFNISIDQFISNGPEYFFADDPWIYFTDTPYPYAPTPNLEETKFNKLIDSFPKIVSGFHNSIEALLKTGNNLIIDHGFHKLDWMNEFVTLLHEYDVFLISVFCGEDELVRREKLRGDRPIGMAIYQSKIVHREMLYDLIINTEEQSSLYAAKKIKSYITYNKPVAIKNVKRELKK